MKNLLGYTWQQVYAEVFTIPPGCKGLTFLPYLTGDRTPHLDPHARGAWVGIGLHHTRAHLMRAALEGVAFSLKQGLDAITNTGVTASKITIAGGGTLEPIWQQLLADILRLPLDISTVAAASARGAAILAGIGINVYKNMLAFQLTAPIAIFPQPDNNSLETAWQRYQLLYPQLHQWQSNCSHK